eukprot:g21993.t1
MGISNGTVSAQEDEKPKPKARYRIIRDLTYSKPGGNELKLDAYLPVTKGPHPAVLVVHGGAWASGSRRQLARYGRALAEHGYAAFLNSYRLAPKHKFPAQIEDCRAAVVWIRENAKKYSVDVNRIGGIGYSAGGHLVALLGTTGAKKKVDGKTVDTRLHCVCAGGAPCDFRELPENSRGLAFWLGGTRKQKPEVYEQASPAAYVTEKCPPMFFFHGSADNLVDIDSPKGMMKLLEAKKVPTEIHIRKGAGHIATALTYECITQSIAFFDKHLKNRKPAGGKNERKQSSRSKRPNIVFLLIDDMGWKDVGFMGSRYYQTPNIDRLARQGMVFHSAYTCGPNCAPTRACLMSGQYSPRHGIYTVGSAERGHAQLRRLIPIRNQTVLDDNVVTIAESLKAAGYVTATMGKWHLGPDPTTQGFDVNVAGNKSGSPRGGYFSPYRNPQLKDGPKQEYLTDRLTDEAVKFLKSNREKPFFLYLPHYAVHTPIQGKPALIEKYRDRKPHNGQSNPTYAAMVDSVDQSVGRILDTLDELKLTENTIVIFSSDNGGYGPATSMTPLRGSKGMLYEGGVRVPTVVRWPEKVSAGSRCDVPVITVDFYPTLLELTGTALPKNQVLDGESLVPLLTQTGSLKRDAIFWHFPAYLQAYRGINRPFRTRPAGAIRHGKYKLIEFFEDGRLELYDLENDISEQNNLAESQPAARRVEILAAADHEIRPFFFQRQGQRLFAVAVVVAVPQFQRQFVVRADAGEIDRRDPIQVSLHQTELQQEEPTMAYTLPDLPYAYDALEPHIDARTMEIHHTKHHQAYINKVNAALEGHADLASKSIEDLVSDLSAVPEDIRGAVRNNGGGHANHALFWTVMKPGGGGDPSGALGEAITSTFGSFDNFKTEFNNAGATRFGSGWAWLKNFSRDFGGKMMSSWGYSESPLIDGNQLVCTPGSQSAMMAALDKKTGRVIWRSPMPGNTGRRGKDGAGYSSIVVSNGGGVKQYIQLVGRGVISVDAKSGKLLWGYNRIANGVANVPTPVVKGDYVFCSSGYGTGAALLKIVKRGRNVRAVEEYFLDAGKLQNHHGGMILVGDHIYCGHGHNNGFPICVNLKTGKVKWGGRIRGPGRGSAAIVFADGHLYFRYESGVMALIEATPTDYKLKGSFKLAVKHDASWPHPVILDGKLYLRDQQSLMCYDISKN